jgi:hypothetical protein
MVTSENKKLIENIYYLSSTLKSANFHEPNITHTNINDLIQDCIFIYSQNALTEKKHIEFLPQEDLLDLNIYLLSFKRMILGLISLSLKSMQVGKLLITTKQQIKDSKVYVTITFKDTGFALSFYEMQKLLKRFGEWSAGPLVGSDIEIHDIIEIIQLHQGFITENTYNKDGKTIILSFPIELSLDTMQKEQSIQTAEILLFKSSSSDNSP